MFGLGTTELIVLGVIVFLIFGAKRLPDIGKGLGGALREFKQIKKDVSPSQAPANEKESNQDQEQKKPPAIESRITEKIIEQVPGVKKAMDVKRKVDKVKDIIK